VAEQQAVDRAVLEELSDATGRDPAFLAELIGTYLEDSAALLTAMRQAIAEANAPELQRAAHSLKSNSASFGAAPLASLCREMELRAGAGRLDGAPELLPRIEAAYTQVEQQLRALRPGPPEVA
jgi:HPt (histidine-containing phosphotransfer) domain-containing protein